MGVGRLLVRGAIGVFFVGHGTQKLFGWFGGHGLDGTGQFFESIGMRPGKRNALAAGAAEAGGGLLLALGLETPLAACLLQSVMITAIREVHAPNGPWVTSGGYEYNVVLTTALFALAESGPGALSLDEARGSSRHGLPWAVAALAAAAAGSYGAKALAERQPVPPAAAAEEPEDEATPREQGIEEAVEL